MVTFSLGPSGPVSVYLLIKTWIKDMEQHRPCFLQSLNETNKKCKQYNEQIPSMDTIGNNVMMLRLGNTHPWVPYKPHGTKSTWWEKREHDRHPWCHDMIPGERPTWISKRYTGDGAEIDAFPIGCPMQLLLKRGRSSDISLTTNVNRCLTEVLINLIC